MSATSEVDRLLGLANDGDSGALRQVLVELHDHLRRIAHRQLSREAEGHTLETDGLVHEAYLRLAGLDRMRWRDPEHVLAMAATTMRRVLVDYADQRHAQKRGGGAVALPLDEVIDEVSDEVCDELASIAPHADALRALDEALSRLAQLSPRQNQVVECRFFGGLSIEETAAVLALSPATVKRDWVSARAWLNRELQT